MGRSIKAGQLAVLEYMCDMERPVEAWEIAQHFMYNRYSSARVVLHRLKRNGDVVSMRPGWYEPTERGMRRLRWHRVKRAQSPVSTVGGGKQAKTK